MDNFLSGTFDAVYFAYPKFISTLTNEVTVEKLLPVSPMTVTDSPIKMEYTIEPDPTALMEKLAKANGFLFRKMGPVMSGGKPVSSTRVRELLIKGEVEKAGKCLGRPFSVFGKVVRGKGHGASLGCPTANLEIHSEVLLPLGVYIASGRFLRTKPNSAHALRSPFPVPRSPGCWLPGVMNFGKRPTYPKKETPRPILELHLLDFKGQVYGKMMEVVLHRFQRPEKRFASEEALRATIHQDVQAVTLTHFLAGYMETMPLRYLTGSTVSFLDGSYLGYKKNTLLRGLA
jgi:hypothetical protein